MIKFRVDVTRRVKYLVFSELYINVFLYWVGRSDGMDIGLVLFVVKMIILIVLGICFLILL